MTKISVASLVASATDAMKMPTGEAGDLAINVGQIKTNVLNATSLLYVGLTGNEVIAGIKTFSSNPIIPDEAYGNSWNGVLEPPTKNALFDRIEPRVSTTTTTPSLTPDPSAFDIYDVNALATAITINNPSVAVNGYAFIVRLKDDGTARAINWGADYQATSGALPSTTTPGEVLYIPIIYNSTALKWEIQVDAAGMTNPMTTAGDLIIGGASGVPDRLAAGSTAGHVLTSNGAGVAPSYQAAAGGWAVTGTTTLTGAATISSTTPSGLLFTNTWTATANNQSMIRVAGTITTRNTASDEIYGLDLAPTINQNAGTPAGQTYVGLNVNAAFGITNGTPVIARFGQSGTYHFNFTQTGATFTRAQNGAWTALSITNSTNGTASKSGILINSSSIGASLYCTAASFTTSGINEAASTILQSNSGGLNIGTTNANATSIWTTNVKRLNIASNGFFTFTPGTLTGLQSAVEFSDYTYEAANHTWVDGTITNQRWAWFKSPSLLGTTTLATATNGYTVYIDKPLAGSLGAITNPSALGLAGNLTMISSRIKAAQGADVASVAGAIALGTDGNTFEITGTNAITLISNLNWQNGSEINLIFTSTATLTDGTANSGTDIGMELAGGANFVASADDVVKLLLCEIGGTQRWREVSRSVN